MNAVSILFVDEMFKWNLSFLIRNAEKAEASDFQIGMRYISWTILVALTFFIYFEGLK